MAAGQIIKGIDGIIEINDGSNTEEIPCLTNWTLEASASLNEESVSCMLSNGDGGSGEGGKWNESFVEGKSFSLSSEHYWQEDQAAGTTGIIDVTDVGKSVTFKLYPNTNAAGKVEYSGSAIVESVSVPSEANGKITQSVTFKGSGQLVKNIIA